MSGTLYGVGVGPGDPELLTIKALRIINEADVIALPKTDEAEIVAFNIAKQAVDLSEKQILELYMPMTRDKQKLNEHHDKAAEQLVEILKQGKNIAFLTLGDPSIYSTYIYLHKRVLQKGFNVQLVAGVPSFCAVAAKLNTSLCEGSQPLHIIPASYKGSDEYLDWNGTKVLMKTGKSFESTRNALAKKELLNNSRMVECCGMPNEKVYNDLNDVNEKASYFSIIVVKDKEKNE
jgi:precorrin-2/cobalt-factor-2 C20-methyltransferase